MLLKGRSQTTLSLCTETPTCPFDTSAQDGPEVPQEQDGSGFRAPGKLC